MPDGQHIRFVAALRGSWELSQYKKTPTNSMEQGPSWEANKLSACQEILWNPMVHYRIQKHPPQWNPKA